MRLGRDGIRRLAARRVVVGHALRHEALARRQLLIVGAELAGFHLLRRSQPRPAMQDDAAIRPPPSTATSSNSLCPQCREHVGNVVLGAGDHQHQRPRPQVRQRLRQRLVGNRRAAQNQRVVVTRLTLQASPMIEAACALSPAAATITTRSALLTSSIRFLVRPARSLSQPEKLSPWLGRAAERRRGEEARVVPIARRPGP